MTLQVGQLHCNCQNKKKPGKLLVCADFLTGLTNGLQDHNYPLPTADGVPTNGVAKYFKIDLLDAYLQVEMEEANKEFLVINMYKALFRAGVIMRAGLDFFSWILGGYYYLKVNEHRGHVAKVFERIRV